MTAAAKEKPKRFPVPTSFAADFQDAPELEEIVRTLVGRYEEISWLCDYTVRVLWKAEAPAAGSGKETAGKCKLLSGELRYFVDADWLIWVAADHAFALEYTQRDIEALLFHELLHCTLKGKPGEERPAVKGHDVETFFDEMRRFGLWTPALRQVKRTVEQLSLDGFEEPEDRVVTAAAKFVKEMRRKGLRVVSAEETEHGAEIRIEADDDDDGEGS